MLALTIGFILDLALGDPHNPLHPVRIIGNFANLVEKLFRRICRDKLKIAGALSWILIVAVTFLVTLAIVKTFYAINPILGVGVQGILIYFCISAKGLKVEGLKVIKTLKSGDIEKARHQLSYIVGRDTAQLDEKSIIRAVVETVAENMSDGIIAPLLFAGLGGAPLAMAYKAINTCDSMFGYKNDKYIDFGYASAKLDDVFNYIPARITAYLIIIASFILGYDYKGSYKIYIRDRYNHTSPNSAHPEAAAAGALGIRLGGANYYFGKLVKKPTIGDETKIIEVSDSYRTNSILFVVSVLGFIVALLLNVIGGILWG
ncbi:adenosylcobinamide-phosphate synthase CbiB [Clostridium cylindrosporum]|uniref:Cobalamin biosynthesis protein CobD n=1 Tax=Clostridium cylindrosporum DSM 605 TaxID=1121307 RepID=A0A0J8DDI2_CLOCY|nr:adenosylcobinamide-phosphate synthase CbiB [Clostridium cylindrosporum]KMT22288.1 cobalamin biosynthesis protein CobD [Clostridium cylindrosporum DSM 605]